MLQTMLPNEQRVFCVNPLEAPIIFGQIAPYFKHGSKLRRETPSSTSARTSDSLP